MDRACETRYRTMDSPLGKIEVSGCERGLHEIRLRGRKTPDAGPPEAPTLPELLVRPEEMTEPLVQCVAWLDAYFHEPEVLPGLPLPAIHHPIFQRDSFTAQVLWKLLEAVKFGDTVSYQQLAALAGNPRAARAVGGAMRSNPGKCRTSFPVAKLLRKGVQAPDPDSTCPELQGHTRRLVGVDSPAVLEIRW
ncbi:methylated-DNA--protein-cysteine methyltransferase isoform X2 [Phoca vitulina]|uniref:methylated-DNA--protein-cysteine methyltransferase isoform X2 n=1 Tax=Phoca vitulina TaxID=9720 RepID=UPI00139634CF|nr:methylated-DNA--protein-cysteine methyltransferase isoform X2 [Phoca vitulina]